VGADLVGYHVIGPATIDLARSKEPCLRQLRQCARIVAAWTKEDETGAPLEEEQEKWVHQWTHEGLCCDLVPLPDDPEGWFNEFVNFWDHQGARDTSSHVKELLPGVRLRVVFAGAQTWGDCPEGVGYNLLYQAHIFGLFPLLGII